MDGPSFEYPVRTLRLGVYDSAVIACCFAVFIRERGSTCIRCIRLFARVHSSSMSCCGKSQMTKKKKSIFLGFIKRWISSFRLKGEPGARGRMFRGQHGVSRGRAGHITLFRHCLSICQAANPSQPCKAAEIMGCRRRSGTQTPSSHFHHGSGAGWPGYV